MTTGGHKPWYERAGGRKFMLAGMGMIFGFVLGLIAKLTPEFSAIIVTCVMAFTASNAFVTGKGTERKPDGQ